MSTVYFVTHPEVVIDPSVPVPEWPLSRRGIERMRLDLERPWMSGVGSVFCSAERKAMDAARIIGDRFGLLPVVVEGLGENDRSATGYLPKQAFETMADAFFAQPEQSVRGWERGADAQRRVVVATERVLREASADGDVAIISHGGVGALLLCHLKDVPISRTEDQPGGGGGNFYSFERATRRLLSGWQRIEE